MHTGFITDLNGTSTDAYDDQGEVKFEPGALVRLGFAPYIEVLGVDLAIEFFLTFGGAYITFPTTSDRRPIDGAAAPLVGAERLIAQAGTRGAPPMSRRVRCRVASERRVSTRPAG